jgi:hypothetical protein
MKLLSNLFSTLMTILPSISELKLISIVSKFSRIPLLMQLRIFNVFTSFECFGFYLQKGHRIEKTECAIFVHLDFLQSPY